jgi:hypothetical protein
MPPSGGDSPATPPAAVQKMVTATITALLTMVSRATRELASDMSVATT